MHSVTRKSPAPAPGENMSQKILLTIAIPTFNRASYLDICLDNLSGQIRKHALSVELIVSDNCSQDTTGDVVEKYKREGLDLCYVRNDENIGPDGNMLQCFHMAQGKYVLILGDDDILLEGALETILEAIADNDYGCVYLKCYGFKDNFKAEFPAYKKGRGNKIVLDPARFIYKTNVMLTFISANIFNKSLIPKDIDFSHFMKTNLIPLAFNLSAVLSAEKSLYLNRMCIAGKTDNSGGYDFCKVFGENCTTCVCTLGNEVWTSGCLRGYGSGCSVIFFRIIS